MAKYLVDLNTHLNLRVAVEADDDDVAADLAWEKAEEYAKTLTGDRAHGVAAEASFDGIGADSVIEVEK